MTINFTPVYYHIPKTGGTYIFNCLMQGIRRCSRKRIGTIKIIDDNQVLAKLIVLNEENVESSGKDSTEKKELHFKNLACDSLDALHIFAVIVPTRGIRMRKAVCGLIFNSRPRPDAYEFITLREPFSREQSLYYYINSELSKHEPNHKIFKSSSFEEHIAGAHFQSHWMLRILLNLSQRENFTESQFHAAREILQNFKIYKTEDSEKALREVFSICYGIENIPPKIFESYQHANSYKKIKLEELPEAARLCFMSRTHWDRKLYEYFTDPLKDSHSFNVRL